MIRTRVRWVLAACFLAAACVRPALGLPAAKSYATDEAGLAEPSAEEQKVLDQLQAVRKQNNLPALVWDKSLSAVCREHSQDMNKWNYFAYYSPRLGDFTYRLHRAGISAANSRYAIFRINLLDDLSKEMAKESAPFYMQPGSTVGVGVAQREKPPGYVITLISHDSLGTLDTFPTMPELKKRYTLSGRLRAGLKKPTILVTYPKGPVASQILGITGDGRYQTTLTFDKGPGEYMVEIAAEGSLGPVIVELLDCFAGASEYPPVPPQEEPIPTPGDLRDAETMMFEMIQKARAEAGVNPLKFDEDLAALGRAHSEDMIRNSFFAHVSPTQGGIGERAEKAGIKAKSFRENLATNSDLGAAHRSLMNSPGHRRTILEPGLARVGIGIVKDGNNTLYITEEYSQDYVAYDTSKLAADLCQQINEARAKVRTPAMRTNAALVRIALENSKAMGEQGKLATTRASDLLKKEKFNNVIIAVQQSSDPPKAGDVSSIMDKKYVIIGAATVQTTNAAGEKVLWTTVLMGEK